MRPARVFVKAKKHQLTVLFTTNQPSVLLNTIFTQQKYNELILQLEGLTLISQKGKSTI